jgi:hypothetical protein
VAATVIALFPLAAHGEPLLYAIFVLDLKLVKWEQPVSHPVEIDAAVISPAVV